MLFFLSTCRKHKVLTVTNHPSSSGAMYLCNTKYPSALLPVWPYPRPKTTAADLNVPREYTPHCSPAEESPGLLQLVLENKIRCKKERHGPTLLRQSPSVLSRPWSITNRFIIYLSRFLVLVWKSSPRLTVMHLKMAPNRASFENRKSNHHRSWLLLWNEASWSLSIPLIIMGT